MFNALFKKSYSVIIFTLMLFLITGLTACDSEPPKLMKAVKQFNTEDELKAHMSHIRRDHMDLLLHKRDKTVIKGIRTEENSLIACINCHIPEKHNGKVLRHTDPEHFCSTCHNYVAADLDCFQCHVDHPVSDINSTSEAPDDSIHNQPSMPTFKPTSKSEERINVTNVESGESVSE